MHLVETLAVAIYQGPIPLLEAPLQAIFRQFAIGEARHRDYFLQQLFQHQTRPYFFAMWLAALLQGLLWLAALLLPLSWLLWLEIEIESLAVRHYESILQKQLPSALQQDIATITQEEREHLRDLVLLRESIQNRV
jgi:demethoxyubiquinone hydroxylase (CLK1/Coq7/Cat5 family)